MSAFGNSPLVLGGNALSVASGSSPVGTTGILTGEVAYGAATNVIKGEAAFAYNEGTNTLTVGALDLTTALTAADGGTGQSSYTVGDLLYASGATTLSKLAGGTSGFVLTAQGAGVAPIYAAVAGAGLGDFSTGGPTVTDGEIVRFDGTGGLTGQASGIQIADVAATNITVSCIDANNLTLAGGSSGASLVLGQGASGIAALTAGSAATAAPLKITNSVAAGYAAVDFYTGATQKASVGYGNASAGVGPDTLILYTVGSGPAIAFAPGGTVKGTFTNTGNLLIGGTTDITGSGGLKVFGTTEATSSTSGGAQFACGVGVAKNIVTAGFYGATPTTRTGSGAISVVSQRTLVDSTGGGALTLANGTVNGQPKIITMAVDGGDATITPDGTKTGWSTIVLTAVGQSVTLAWYTTYGWMIEATYGSPTVNP